MAADQLRSKNPSCAIIIGTAGESSANILCALTHDLVERGLNAGDLVKALATHIGGGGGGRPEMAQAGGKRADGLQAALDAGVQAIQRQLEET
jgi:alanyl-tRNA synthetase